jgi:hypothetical protein
MFAKKEANKMATGYFERLMFGGVTLIDESSTISTEVQDPHGVPSGKIIRMSDEWQVEFKWSLHGPGIALLGGNFELEVDGEYLGQEVVLGKATVLAAAGVPNPATPSLDFTKTVKVAAHVIPKEGVYRIIKHLHYTAPFFGLKTAAFVEGEDIEFY